MPECSNCGSHVSPDFVRVSWPSDVEDPPACPNCEELTVDPNEENGYREKRS